MSPSRSRWATVFVVSALLGCGGDGGGSSHRLHATLGTYEDASGRAGIALLATIRDGSGAGPAEPWTVTVRTPAGAEAVTLDYPAGGHGSLLARWTPTVAPSEGDWEIVASGGGETLHANAALAAGGLAVPTLALATDGSSLSWEPVAGAAVYLCRVFAGGALELERYSGTPTCDLAALPAGAWSASVLALSAEIPAIAESTAQSPPLPARFDVAEARLAFVRSGNDTPAAQLRASGGAYDDGIGGRALAVWLSIGAPDGSGTSDAWEIEITGPNLPPSDPLTISYGAPLPRLLAWAPAIPATPGTYGVVARSAAGVLVMQFTVGDPSWLDLPLGVAASDGAQGSARVTWEPVAGAAAYLVRAYDAETGAFAASQWAAGTDTTFVQGSFVAGRTYQVWVAATDADMLGGAAPGQVAVSEDVFEFATFVAR